MMREGTAGESGKDVLVRTSHRALVAEESFIGPVGQAQREVPGSVMYSIRMPQAALGVQCPKCGLSFWAAGPTGYEDELPICDACLLESCHPLGMLLALALVTRQLANLQVGEGGDYDQALRETGIFAQVYEQVASQDGPPRRFELPEKYRRWDDEGIPS